VVVDHVHDPDRGFVGQHEAGGVDLPQVVGRLPLEAEVGLSGPLRLQRHQVVAYEGLMDG
jgi:hypothetical protein